MNIVQADLNAGELEAAPAATNPMSSRFYRLPILHRWALLVPSNRRLLATPDAPAVVLVGVVRGDPRFPDGAAIVTSCVLELDPQRGFARTRATRYRLGTPSPLFLRRLHELGYAVEAFARLAPEANRRGFAAERRGVASSLPAGAGSQAPQPGGCTSFDPV